jgi:predicted lipoprotein with Yx(FWY)xxD motif
MSRCFSLGILSALCVATVAVADTESSSAPYSTPPGITLVDVVKVIGNAPVQYLWRRLGDANGKPLYTFDEEAASGRVLCVADCAAEFIPYIARIGKTDTPDWGTDWSVVVRPDGARQWAYQGVPLYSYSGKDPAGEPSQGGLSTTGAEDPAIKNPASTIYSPKKGWRRAAYMPEKTFIPPPELELVNLPTANGYGLVDSVSQKVVYALNSAPADAGAWNAVHAPDLAIAAGPFTVIATEHGAKQWAYGGRRLYTYEADYSTSDVRGLQSGEAGVRVALVNKHFMPESLALNIVPIRGPLITTTKGLSVYTQTRQQLQYGGRLTRDGYRYPYSSAKAVSVFGCTEACLKTWKPVLAPRNATARGFWEVAVRPDTKQRQWAYKGAPLYTFTGDKRLGDIEGNNRHEIVWGDAEGKRSLALTGGDEYNSKYRAGSGLYWHIAGLYF